jgi:vitamin B12 transporter
MDRYPPSSNLDMRAVLLPVLALAHVLLQAQTAPVPQPVSGPTVITVTGYPMPPSTIPAAVTVIEQDVLGPNCSDSSVDLLSTSALLNVSRNGGQGGYGSITIRGGKPNFTLVLLDGIEINDISDSLGGAVDFSALSTGNIRQVEIVRGPLSAVYGSDSVSGVVNFVSRRGESQPSLDITSELGGFWTRGVGVNAAGLFGKLDYSFSGSFLGIGEQVKKDPYQLGTGAFHSGIALASDKFLTVTTRFADSVTQGFPVGGGGPEYSLVQQPQRVEARQFLLGFEFDQKVAPFWSYGIAFDFFDRRQDLVIPAILDRIPPSLQSIPAIQGNTSFQRYHGSFSNSLRLAKSLSVHLTSGLRQDDGRSDSVLGGKTPERFDLNRTNAYASGDLLYTVARWTASLGIRADHNSGLGALLSPRAGLSYQIVPGQLRFHVSAGRGYKLPSIYSLGDPLIGNKTLRPEFNKSIDAGLSLDLFSKRLSIEAVYFGNWYHDLIDFSAQQFRLVNRSAVQTRGLELEAKTRLNSRIQLSGSYSYLDWKLNPSVEPFRDVPHWRVAGGIAWTPSQRWQWGVEALAVGRRTDFQLPVPLESSVGGYATVSLHASCELSERVTSFFRAENLLNARYHQFVGFPDPGIYFRVGLIYHAWKPGQRH